ncbi:MAG: YbaN family protein [Candidatus Manganitrophaceae bacterium]
MKNIVRWFLIVVGTLSVGLGLLGIFLPVLPTTPFLLLAAFCYGRSSEWFHRWLLTNRWFGEYIRNYREGRGMPLRDKLFTVSALWLTIGSTSSYAILVWWGRLILLAIATGVTTYLLLRVKTFKPEVAVPPAERSSLAERAESDRARSGS